ncbi:MAG: hypothetical protein SVU32_06815, partial [Candidatus Nanohaloarchaea archaeon]|nr:hypothetical protein [Candidatus Nanohaloarchaea archaeon]
MKGDREYREYLEIDGGPDVEIKPYEEAEKLQDEVDVPGIPEVNLDAWAEFGNTEYMFPDRKEPAYPLEEIEKGNIAFVARVAESTEDYETGDPAGFGVLDISVDEDAYAAVDGLEYGTPVEWSDPDVGATASMRALAVAPAFQGYGIATALRGISHALIDEVETELGDQYELVRSTETNYLTTGSQKTHSREGMQEIAFQPLRFNNGEYGETKRGDKVINGEVWMADKTPERLQAADEELLDVAGV